MHAYEFLRADPSKEQQFPVGAWGYPLPQQHFLASQLSLDSPFAQILLLRLQMKQRNLPFGSQPHAPFCQLTPGSGPLAVASGSSPCFPVLVAFHSQVLKGSFQDAPFCFLCNPGISLINSTCTGSVMSIWLRAFISTAGCAQREMLPLSL